MIQLVNDCSIFLGLRLIYLAIKVIHFMKVGVRSSFNCSSKKLTLFTYSSTTSALYAYMSFPSPSPKGYAWFVLYSEGDRPPWRLKYIRTHFNPFTYTTVMWNLLHNKIFRYILNRHYSGCVRLVCTYCKLFIKDPFGFIFYP